MDSPPFLITVGLWLLSLCVESKLSPTVVHKSLPVCLSKFQPPSDFCCCVVFLFTFIYLLGEGHTNQSAHVEVRGQLVGSCFSLLPYGFGESNLDIQAWWQAPLPPEPSCRPIGIVYFKNRVPVNKVLRLKAGA